MSILTPKYEIPNPPCPECGNESTFCHSGSPVTGGIFTCNNRYCRYCFEWRPKKKRKAKKK